jgi:hypothetical protein
MTDRTSDALIAQGRIERFIWARNRSLKITVLKACDNTFPLVFKRCMAVEAEPEIVIFPPFCLKLQIPEGLGMSRPPPLIVDGSVTPAAFGRSNCRQPLWGILSGQGSLPGMREWGEGRILGLKVGLGTRITRR